MPPFLEGQCCYSSDDKTPFLGAKTILTGYVQTYVLFCFVLKPWKNVSLTCLMFFMLETMLLQSSSSDYIRGCLPGYSLQFGSNKTLFYSYYRLFIILNILQLCQLFLNKAGGKKKKTQSLQLNYHNQSSKQSHTVSLMLWPTVPFSGIYNSISEVFPLHLFHDVRALKLKICNTHWKLYHILRLCAMVKRILLSLPVKYS